MWGWSPFACVSVCMFVCLCMWENVFVCNAACVYTHHYLWVELIQSTRNIIQYYVYYNIVIFVVFRINHLWWFTARFHTGIIIIIIIISGISVLMLLNLPSLTDWHQPVRYSSTQHDNLYEQLLVHHQMNVQNKIQPDRLLLCLIW